MSNEIAVVPLEEKIEQDFQLEIIKVIPDPEAAISKLKEKYMTLKVVDKASFKKAEEARKDVKNVRIVGEKICDSQRATLEEKKKGWIKKKEQWASVVGEIEDYLETQTDEWKQAEQKRKDDEAAKAEEERQRLDVRLLERQQEFGKLGVLYSDKTFMLGDIRYGYDQVREADDELYRNEILPAFTAIFEQHEEERRQQEIAKQEAEEKQRQEAKQLLLEKEELKRQQEQMKNDRFDLRVMKLATIGFPDPLYAVTGGVMDMTNEQFDSYFTEKKELVEKAKQAEADRKERERIAEEQRKITEAKDKLFNERSNTLKGIGMGCDNVRFYYQDIANILVGLVREMTDEQFAEYTKSTSANIEDARKQAEIERQEELERQRIALEKKAIGLSRFNTLKNLGVEGWEQENLAEMSEEDWAAELSEAKEAYDKIQHKEWLEQERIKKVQADERENERLAELSENKRWREWVEKKLIQFMADIPKFESKRYVRARAIATEKIEEIITLKPGNF